MLIFNEAKVFRDFYCCLINAYFIVPNNASNTVLYNPIGYVAFVSADGVLSIADNIIFFFIRYIRSSFCLMMLSAMFITRPPNG